MATTAEDYRLTGIVLAAVILIVGLVLTAVDANSTIFRELSAVAWCAILVFGIQWLAWIPASIGRDRAILRSDRRDDVSRGSRFQPMDGL